MPVLSLIIPVYNTEQYLNRCLDSIFKQSYSKIEVIVVDDCSPGSAEKIVTGYQQKYHNLKYFKHEQNRGLFLARLTGYTHATGEYIAFLDSDDYVTRDFYRTLMEKAIRSQADIIIGRTIIEKADGSHFIYSFHDCCLNFECLEGKDIQNTFWEQEGLCYSWHTIWNKIYSRRIWEKAFPFFQKIDTHIIMTEDIAFSSVLFYFAQKISTVKNNAYYYCENKNASTNSANLSIKKYIKNMQDMVIVFNFVHDFLTEQNASAFIMSKYDSFRQYYAKMWKSHGLSTYSGEEKKKALELVEQFYPNLDSTIQFEDHFFNTVLTPWAGGLEYAKDLISDDKYQWVSFDIFDTLITRPVYNPEDVWSFIDPLFRELMHTDTAFHKLRLEGERMAREYWGKKAPKKQDITLNQIYNFLADFYHIPQNVTTQLMHKEIDLELTLSSIRSSGKELFEFAQAIGKKIVLISDMYLETETIKTILDMHGYGGYYHLFLSSDIGLTKNTGALFQYVLNFLQVDGKHLLHIGDTWSSDIEKPKKFGIETFFLPKAKDAMENKINGIQTNSCAFLGDYACSDIINRKAYKKSIGYGALLSIVANQYFDNPYRYFNSETDFNIDPYFIGYYPVGMHLLGLTKWLIEESMQYGYKKLYFMSRDGYLPMLVYKQMAALYPDAPEAEYLYTSRKALMPFILSHLYDFYDMPIEIVNHTPKTVLSLLSFCTVDMVLEKLESLLASHHLAIDSCFKDRMEFNLFITIFLNSLYDEAKHRSAQELCTLYYSKIETNSATVDMGYSGRIQGAISAAVGRGIDVFFVHSDSKQYQVESQAHKFHIHTFYDFTPCMTGLIREHIFSSPEPSCIGFYWKNQKPVPAFEEEVKIYQDRFIVGQIQSGAQDFIKSFISKLGNYYHELPIKPVEISYPYEGFLRYMKSCDLKIFDASFFEDTVYGARKDLKISEFLKQQYTEFNILNRISDELSPAHLSYSDMLADHLRGRNRLLKFMIYLFADRENLRVKLWYRLQGNPVAFKICRGIYRKFLQ